jgi:hypothetical protein
MTHETAEKQIRALQKAFLTEIERHPIYEVLEPADFNALRKRVFRGTFAAYRLGVIGTDAMGTGPTAIYDHFYGWLDQAGEYLPRSVQRDVAGRCFLTALEAFRIGAMVAGHAPDPERGESREAARV